MGFRLVDSKTIRVLNQFALSATEFLFFSFMFHLFCAHSFALSKAREPPQMIAPKIYGFERPYFVLSH